MICTPHLILFSNQIRKNVVVGACKTYGGKQRFMKGFGGKP